MAEFDQSAIFLYLDGHDQEQRRMLSKNLSLPISNCFSLFFTHKKVSPFLPWICLCHLYMPAGPSVYLAAAPFSSVSWFLLVHAAFFLLRIWYFFAVWRVWHVTDTLTMTAFARTWSKRSYKYSSFLFLTHSFPFAPSHVLCWIIAPEASPGRCCTCAASISLCPFSLTARVHLRIRALSKGERGV